MKRLSLKVLQKLESINTNIQIAIYLPVVSGPQNTATNTSYFNHAMSKLKQIFQSESIPSKRQQELKRTLHAVYQELNLQINGKGLAIFIDNKDQVSVYATAFTVHPVIYYMAPNIQLEPIREYYQDNKAYWVLSLSQKGCRLFRGERDNLSEISDTILGKDMSTVLRFDEAASRDIQAHQIGPQGGSQASEGFHGHGGFKDKQKKYLEQYMRVIDKHIHMYTNNNKLPLILLGADYSQSIYKKVSKYRNILQSNQALNVRHSSIDSIKDIVAPLRQQSI